MNADATRVCPFCAETIKSQAKLCPRCRQWLVLRSFRHPLVGMVVVGVPALCVLIAVCATLFNMLDRLGNPRPYYSEFPNAIRIMESRMGWVQTSDGLRIYITGILTNNSPVAWKDVEFDCRFFNATGKLVDAGVGRSYPTVAADDDSAFRVGFAPTSPTNDYATFRISVSSARNSRSL
jgi:hypothetical protein